MEVNQQSIDSVTHKSVHIFKVSANKSLNMNKKYCGNRKQDKPLFGFNCELASSNNYKTRKQYNKFKSLQTNLICIKLARHISRI